MIYQGSKKYPVQEIIIHCSATPPDWSAGAKTSAKVAEIKRWHTTPVKDGGRGWKDIGYHWLIDRDGTIAKGRDETVIGAHVVDHNAGTIGICLIGGGGSNEDDVFAKHFTPDQLASLKRLVAAIKGRTDIKKISGHNQYAAKACPGFQVKELKL